MYNGGTMDREGSMNSRMVNDKKLNNYLMQAQKII